MARNAARTPSGGGRRISVFAGAPVRQELGELVRLSWPVVLSRLGIMTMGLVDIIVVGHYSTVQLGYHALGWAPTAVVLTTAIGMMSGVQVMTARHIGEGRREAAGGVFRRGIVYALWLGLAAAVLVVTLGPIGLRHIGLEADLAEGASRVLMVLGLSLPFFLLSTAATFFLEALSRPKPATLAMWACNGLNLALNLLLVPGALGLPAFGAVGSVAATFGSRVVLAAWLIIYIMRMRDARALGLWAKPVDGPDAAREQRKVGYGAGASYFVEVGAFNVMSLYAGWLGGLALAGWTVILNMSAMIFMIPLGLSAATSVLVGRAYGANDKGGVVRSGVLGFGLCAVLLTGVALAVFAFAPAIAGFYTTDPALIAIVAPGLVMCCLFFTADGLQSVAAQALRARADVWWPTAIHTLSYAGLMVPLAWFLAFPAGLGLTGVIGAVIAASFVVAGLLLGRFWLLTRRG